MMEKIKRYKNIAPTFQKNSKGILKLFSAKQSEEDLKEIKNYFTKKGNENPG